MPHSLYAGHCNVFTIICNRTWGGSVLGVCNNSCGNPREFQKHSLLMCIIYLWTQELNLCLHSIINENDQTIICFTCSRQSVSWLVQPSWDVQVCGRTLYSRQYMTTIYDVQHGNRSWMCCCTLLCLFYLRSALFANNVNIHVKVNNDYGKSVFSAEVMAHSMDMTIV
jgi:hypothetical protein